MALGEPLEEPVVFGQGAGDRGQLLTPDRIRATICDVCRGPAVNVAHMPNQVAHGPFRAGRDGRAQVGAGRGRSQQSALSPQRLDMLRELHQGSLRVRPGSAG